MRNASFALVFIIPCVFGCGEDFTAFSSSTGAGGGGSPAAGGAGGDNQGGDMGGAAGAGGFDPAQDPLAQINHPGAMECREANVELVFSGTATDPQDGALAGGALVWTSDQEGQIGTGASFMHAPAVLGEQVITLAATDLDGNVGLDQVMLEIAQSCP